MEVNNYDELCGAIGSQEANIIIASSFVFTGKITVEYEVTIEGMDNPVLSREPSFTDSLFEITDAGNLKLKNFSINSNGENVTALASLIINNGGLLLNNIHIYNVNTSVNGGVISSSGASTLSIENGCVFEHCNILGDGGAIYFDSSSLLNISDSKFIFNEACNGGAINIIGEGTTNIISSIFKSNHASKNYGGAINVGKVCNIDISKCHFIDNSTNYGGGAVTLTNGVVGVIINCDFFNNHTQNDGGAIFIGVNDQETNIKIETCNFNSNDAIKYGGAIFANGNQLLNFSLLNCHFIKNKAYIGGGTSLISVNENKIDECIFDSNSANNGGASFYAGANTYNINYNSFINNTANSCGAIYAYGITDKVKLIINNCDFTENNSKEDGGGIGVLYSDLTIEKSQFDKNSASNGAAIMGMGKVKLNICNSMITNNKSKNNGGGIFNDDETSITNSIIEGNSAGANGGGLIFIKIGNITFADCRIVDNTALNGAGVFIDGEHLTSVNKCHILNNNAENNGGGIYLEQNKNLDNILELTGGNELSLNSAKCGKDIYNAGIINIKGVNHLKDGIFIDSKDNILYLIGTINGSHINIENSTYIDSLNDNNPILIAKATDNYSPLDNNDLNAFKNNYQEFDTREIVTDDDNTSIKITSSHRYKITYNNLMGAVNNNPDTFNEIPVLLNEPTLYGYEFVDWIDHNGNIATEINKLEDTTLTAIWNKIEFNISFNSNTNNFVENIPCSHVANLGEDYTVPDNIPIRKGYCFLNWNTSPDGSGEVFYPNQKINNIDKEYSFHAIWEKIIYNNNNKISCIPYNCNFNCICCNCKKKMHDICLCDK